MYVYVDFLRCFNFKAFSRLIFLAFVDYRLFSVALFLAVLGTVGEVGMTITVLQNGNPASGIRKSGLGRCSIEELS